ncbi:MAG TPA: BTAD domain-containing putative transcriptional regulator [Actinophytocola sp.]|uniref:AfsR/SARP family transcriptional regulator n=1 Tax=Actinophytocola sp. TaxID=1872138 RepID=UPI002F95C184
MNDLRFRLLGPMEIVCEGSALPLPGSAERALLAQLLLSPGRTIPTSTLIDRLWAGSTLPVDPTNALQIRVSKLRRSLNANRTPDLVTREGVGYRANVDPEAVDAIDFAHRIRRARDATAAVSGQDVGPEVLETNLAAYDAALELWRGEPLSDFNTEQWAISEAARLNALRITALTERAQTALALGRHHEVVHDLEPVVGDDPALESLTGLLMVALYRGGRQADALEVYARTRQTLDEELGLEPSVTLRSLQERMLRQDESLGAQAEMAVPVRAPASAHRRPVGPDGPMGMRGGAVPAAPTNLPTVVRPLIGRDEALESLRTLLPGVRLLSLVGPGGAGKTSLALTLAVHALPEFPDGVFGVRLASLDTANQVPVAVADALGMPMDGAAAERDIRQRLCSYLANRRLLLLLDNCEHVVDAAAGLADDILGRCAEVTILTTSREALAVPDEIQFNVGPLAAPPEDAPVDHVLTYPAAQLFVERARAARPGTAFDETNIVAIGRVTRALDGMPLAVELAAARASTMSPVEISNRLDHRFTLLTSGSRTAEARQQTLRATVDWSYALLSGDEQRLFNRLSVFQGGWTMDAAEAVLDDADTPDGFVLDAVARLVERSMVIVDPGAPTRYRMLETLRQYAAEQLLDSGEVASVAAHHARHFHDLVVAAEFDLRGPRQRDALLLLRREQPNIRAALNWLSGPDGDLDQAMEMAGSLALFWHLGRHLEGREVLQRLLPLGGGEQARAHALQAVSIVERPRGCLVHPSPLCADTAQESLVMFDAEDDRSRAALSRVLLAVEGVTGADPERSQALLAEAEQQFRADNDDWGLGVIGFVRMETALKTGHLDTAIAVGRAAAARFRRLDDYWGLSAILYHLGWGLRQFGRNEDGAHELEEAIDVAASAGLYNTVQWALADLALVHLNLGRHDLARDLFDRADAASEHIGDGAGTILAHYGHGLLALQDGDLDAAERRLMLARDGFSLLKTPVWEGWALLTLARCHELRHGPRTAREPYETALRLGRQAGEPGLTASALEGLARTWAPEEPDQAAALDLAASHVRDRLGRPRPRYQDTWHTGQADDSPAIQQRAPHPTG